MKWMSEVKIKYFFLKMVLNLIPFFLIANANIFLKHLCAFYPMRIKY